MKNFELPKSEWLLKELDSECINYKAGEHTVTILDDCSISDVYDLGCMITKAERNAHWQTPEILTYNAGNAIKLKAAIDEYQKNSYRNINSMKFNDVGTQTEVTILPTYAADLISIGMYYERQFDKKETV